MKLKSRTAQSALCGTRITEKENDMREKATVEAEIAENQRKQRKVNEEYSQREAPLTSKIKPLEEKIAGIEKAKSEIKCPKISPWFAVGAVMTGAFAAANFFYLKWAWQLTVAALAVMAVLLIIRSVFKGKAEKLFSEMKDEKDAEIKAVDDQIYNIRATDPRLIELGRQGLQLDSKISDLKEELKQIKLAEQIGTNNLIIRANQSGAYYCFINSAGKFDSIDRYTIYIKVDGQDRGTVSEPFSIIPLTPGFHSVSIIFDTNVGCTFTLTPDIQFSLKESNQYISLVKPFYDIKTKSFGVDKLVTKDIDEFLNHSNFSRYQFDSYVDSI